jgi:hypothetical protein
MEIATMRTAKTVHLDSHATATLRYIRASMEGAANVPIPGSAGIVMGGVGLIATALSLLPQLAAHWFFIWLAAAPFAASVGGLLLARSVPVASFIAPGTPGRKLAYGLLPCLFAGAAMTVVLASADLSAAIPGTWLLLYGCALISASASTTAIVASMGLVFVAFGVAAFVAPVPFHVPLLGAGFGGLHILYGILIGRGVHGGKS